MANEPSGSAVFDTYQNDYTQLTATISRRINSQIPSATGEKRKELIRSAERELEEAVEILDQMELELRNIPTAMRTKLQQRYKTYKSDFAQLQKDLKRIAAVGERDELLAGTIGDLDRNSTDQRQRLLDNNARMDASTQRLKEAIAIGNETEEIGKNVLTNLKSQGEQMQHASKTLDEVDDTLSRSTRILKGMARRVVTNKIITAMIILVLLGIIGLIVYLAIP